MLYLRVNRRSFLASATGAALVVALPSCRSTSGLGERDRRALLRMARLLYPHEALTDDVYLEALAPFLALADDDPALARELQSGLESLDGTAGADWSGAPVEDQVRALTRIEDGTFFGTVQEAVRTRLYEHPEVWDFLGYEGPSLELGGYINRGFDDIDWLPED